MKTILLCSFLVISFTTTYSQVFGVVTSNTAYAFYQGDWYSYTISGDNPKVSTANDTIVVATSRFVYLFANRQWGQVGPLNAGDGRDINITISQGVIGVTTTRNGYAFTFNNRQWHRDQLPISGTPKAITSKNGNLLLITNSFLYAFDKSTGRWKQQQLRGIPTDYTH